MRLRKQQNNPVALRTDTLPPPAPLSRVTQGLYTLLVIGLLVYIGFLGWHFFTRLEVRGVVMVEELRVAATREGVLDARVAGGEAVQRGDTLAVIDPVLGCEVSVAQDARLEQTRHRLRVAREGERLANLVLEQVRERAPGSQVSRALELDGSRGRTLLDWQLDLQRARQELALASVTRESLEQRLAEVIAEAAIGPPECRPQAVEAPQKGVIASSLQRSGEFVERGETIALLRSDDADVYIEVYPESDELAALERGKTVRVEFPDGREVRAVITAVGAAAASAPDLETEAYVPVENALRARIEALNPQEAERWRQYQRMDVTVQVKR